MVACDTRQLGPGSVEVKWTTNIYYPTQCPDGIGTIEDIASNSSIFHNATSDHDDIVCGASQFFENQIHHLSQTGIFVLEKLRNAKEQIGCFIFGESFASEQEENDFGKQYPALSGRDRR